MFLPLRKGAFLLITCAMVLQRGSCDWKIERSSIPLIEAMANRKLDEARKILRHGAQLNVRDNHGFTPLWYAIHSGYPDFAGELLRAGADPRMTTAGGDTTLMAAAWRDDTKTARLLLDRGVPVNTTNINGETALMTAIHRCWDGKTALPPEAAEAAKNDPEIQGRRDTFENCRDGKMVQLLRVLNIDGDKSRYHQQSGY